MGAPLDPEFRSTFLAVSVLLTGFTDLELEGTGEVDEYGELVQEFLEAITDTTLRHRIEVLVSHPDAASAVAAAVAPDPTDALATLLQNISMLWYLSTWFQLPPTFYTELGVDRPAIDTTHIPSTAAYAQGLAWRVACAHPPAARPTGYGGWSVPPAVPTHELPPLARGGVR